VKPYPYMPGVPAAGHISGGYWHPSGIEGCPKCPSSRATHRNRRGQVMRDGTQVWVQVNRDRFVVGELREVAGNGEGEATVAYKGTRVYRHIDDLHVRVLPRGRAS
jgi:hypothetical protein